MMMMRCENEYQCEYSDEIEIRNTSNNIAWAMLSRDLRMSQLVLFVLSC